MNYLRNKKNTYDTTRRPFLFGVILTVLSTGHAHAQKASLAEDYYSNPILAGDYPDPSIFRDGNNYYMTHSSFEYYPGLLIWHSTDMVGGGQLRFLAKGNNPGNSSPLIFVPRDESYELTIQYELEGTTTGGLVLFYNQDMYAGLVTNGNNFTIYRRGQSMNHGRNPLGRTGYLKIRNVEHILTFHYSADGRDWKKIQRSFSTEAYNHTAFGGFVSLRTGVVSMGEGSVIFRDFTYSEID